MTRVLLYLSLLFVVIPASAAPSTAVEVDPVTTAQPVASTKYSRLEHAKKAAGWLRPPTKLPHGYMFEDAEIDGGKKEAWLRYSNEKNEKQVFSIFQQHTKAEKNVEFTAVEGGFYWQDGKDRFLIAGLSEAQAKLVAHSVK